MNITKIISKTFDSRLKQIDLYATQAGEIQHRVLNRLVHQAARTEWGKKYDYASIRNYEDFRKRVPIQTYEEIKPYVERLRAGEQNLLWPSEIRWFAKSSGTTNDKSKFLPVSKEALEDIHYRGGKDAAALYFRINPDSRFFSGKGLILGGSHSPNLNSNHSLVGDLSAILIQNVSPLINFIRVPSKKIALMSEWETKIEAIANSTIPVNVTSLSGVPSWMLVLIKRILEKTGKQTLEEVWPNLEVFFHGGVAFTPYREQYKQVIHSEKMHYVETYNASEGYFGTQNELSDPAMLLMIDYGIFYEFIPLEEVGKENPRAYCLEEVELNKNYAMVISTSCGLWRYMIGDTVKFTRKNPYKFIITGRTKHFINAFGEELIVDNAEKGLAKACTETGAQVSDYSAAPVFMDEHAKCRHQWLIEFARMPDSIEKFATILDTTLKEVNSDYEAKRWKDIALQPLEVIVARRGLFHDWLAQKGKLGGQHKIPRLSNTREYIEEMLTLNK
ncbi:GH3 auxin-responsive promoter family protein [uncultured Bacteroides sp.]|uniref:GH3 auxin-responsive promoter family protein n=1 Tax=uncultured Bacteroides sp. TaxID=162156 RepID=UPI0026744818|nr:GH3 auxin-responsive promoter family protein [uncultured Bacteroides sp.]